MRNVVALLEQHAHNRLTGWLNQIQHFGNVDPIASPSLQQSSCQMWPNWKCTPSIRVAHQNETNKLARWRQLVGAQRYITESRRITTYWVIMGDMNLYYWNEDFFFDVWELSMLGPGCTFMA